MLIRYTGPKESKKIEFSNKPTYIFSPTCEVEDKDVAAFLLHRDRLGLFEVVKHEEEEPSGPVLVKKKGK